MNHLIAKKPLELFFITDTLKDDFEHMVLDSYYDSGWCDLHHLADHVDNFAVWTVVEEETGYPFTFEEDSEWMELNRGDIIGENYYDLLQDVGEVLDYHRMFHAWHDKGEGEYRLVGDFYHMPIIQVW